MNCHLQDFSQLVVLISSMPLDSIHALPTVIMHPGIIGVLICMLVDIIHPRVICSVARSLSQS